MNFISLGHIDKNLIPILIGCIFCFLDRILEKFDDGTFSKNIILTNVFVSFSRFLAVIPYIILKIRSKNVDNTDSNNINNNIIEYIYIDKKEVNFKNKLEYLIISSILYFIQSIIFVYIIKIQTSSWSLYILITPIFYYLIFKIKLYKHHYLSIILILLIGLIIDLVLENLQYDLLNNFWLLLLKFVREIIFSLHNVIAKYIMEKKFVSVYEYSFYNGLFNLLLLGIAILIDSLFFGSFKNYKDYFINFTNKELLIIAGGMLTQFFLNLSLLFTIKNNSPYHAFIIYVFGQFAFYIDFSEFSTIVFICLIFILFFSLIFNEIIELNFCGLSYNTKRNISERAKSEDIYAIENETVVENTEEINENSLELNNEEIYD